MAVILNTDLPESAPLDAASVETLIARELLSSGTETTDDSTRDTMADLGVYTGRYRSQDGTDVEIVARDGAWVLVTPDSESEPYFPVGKGRFVDAEWPEWIWHIRFEDSGSPHMRVVGSDHGWQDEWQLFRLPEE